jgi:hypothetical protein
LNRQFGIQIEQQIVVVVAAETRSNQQEADDGIGAIAAANKRSNCLAKSPDLALCNGVLRKPSTGPRPKDALSPSPLFRVRSTAVVRFLGPNRIKSRPKVVAEISLLLFKALAISLLTPRVDRF